MKYKLRMEPDAVLEAVTSSVTLARRTCDDVEWSAEDGSRTEPDFLAAASKPRSARVPPRSTSPTPSATPCPRT